MLYFTLKIHPLLRWIEILFQFAFIAKNHVVEEKKNEQRNLELISTARLESALYLFELKLFRLYV